MEIKKIISVFDFDETLRKRKFLELVLYNTFFKKTFNENKISPLIKKVVSFFEKMINYDIYEDAKFFAERLSDYGSNYIYTLNEKDITLSFLEQYDVRHYFKEIIITSKKSQTDLISKLKNIEECDETELKDYLCIAFGDSIEDLAIAEYFHYNIKIGFGSKFDKFSPELKKYADFFVKCVSRPETKNEILSKIEKMIKGYLA